MRGFSCVAFDSAAQQRFIVAASAESDGFLLALRYILGKSSMIVVEDYAHRFDWNKIRILKSWPIPLDAVSVTANRNYVAIATKGEIEIYNTDGQKRGSVGRRTRRGQHTDYIAVQLSSNKNMLAAIDNEDRSVSVYGLKRQTWVLHAKVRYSLIRIRQLRSASTTFSATFLTPQNFAVQYLADHGKQ